MVYSLVMGFPGGSNGRVCVQCRLPAFDHWVRKIPWRRKWQPTPVFSPGKSHGQKSLLGYSLWGPKELDKTEWLTLSLFSYLVIEQVTFISPSAFLGLGLEVWLLAMVSWFNISFIVVVQSLSCVWLCDLMDCSTPGFPVFHCLSEFARTRIHWVMMPSNHPSNHLIIGRPLLPPSVLPSIRIFPIFPAGGQSIGASESVLPMNI